MAGNAKLAILITAKDAASATLDKVGGKFGALGKAAKVALLGVGVGGVAAAVGLFKVGADFDKAFDTIRVGTGATGDDLKTLQGDFKSVFKGIPTDMTSASDAITQFNTLTGATGPALQNMAKSGLEAARMLGEDSTALIGAAGKAFNVFEVGADAANGVLDAVFTASQKSNVPMTKLLGTLQTYGPVLKNLGFGIAQSTAFFASLEKAGIDVSRVMPGLNAFMRKLSDEGVTDLSGALDEQIEKIKGAATESEALNLATQAFGAEGAQRLSVAIRTGALDLDEFTKSLFDSEGAILDTAKDTESLSEKFTRFKNTVLVAIQPLATGFFDGLSKVATLIETKVVPALQEWWKEHGPKIVDSLRDIGRGLEDFGRLILPILKTVLEKALRPLGEWFYRNETAIKAAMVAIGAVMVVAFTAWAVSAGAAALATIAAAAPVIALVAAIGLLAAGIFLLVTNFDTVKATIESWIEKIREIPVVGEIFDAMVNVVKDKIDAIVGIFQGLIDFGKELISFFKNVFTGEWGAAWEDIKDMAKIAIGLFLDYLQLTFFGTIKSILESIVPWDWVKEAFNTAKDNMVGAFQAVLDFVTGIPGKLAELATEFGKAAFALGRAIIRGIKDGINTGLFLVKSAFNGLIGLFERGINYIIGKWNALEFTVSGPWGIGSATIGTPDLPLVNIPRLASLAGGGIIPPGVVTPAILHGGAYGEAVIPLPRGGGGGGVTLIQNFNTKYPPDRRQLREEGRVLRRELERQQLMS